MPNAQCLVTNDVICPHCGFDNLPGSEECNRCQQDLTQLDRPVAQDRVERSLIEDRVGVLHARPPVTVRPTATVCQAIRTMLENNVGALLVVDDGEKVVGIFSERDLLTKVAGVRDDFGEQAVCKFMTGKLETARPEHTLAFVLHQMDCGGYRHVPVVEDGRPVAMISVRDMLRHITRLCKDH
jgi:CBS domain-containing protein